MLLQGGLGRLAAWHLPGGPVGPPARWDYPDNRRMGEMERREESEGQNQKEEEREGGRGTGNGGQAPVAKEGKALFGYWRRGPRVPSYATTDGAGLST